MTAEAWHIMIGALITIQLGVNGFLCITQIAQGIKIATMTARLDVLMKDRDQDISGSWRIPKDFNP